MIEERQGDAELEAMATRAELHAQDPVIDYPVDGMIRLTGILEMGKQPQTSVYPLLSVWLGEKTGQFQVTRAEPIIPEYPAESELRQVSELGLRLLAEKEALAALQDPQMQGRPIVIEGWLHVQQGSLDVRSVRAAATSQGTPAEEGQARP